MLLSTGNQHHSHNGDRYGQQYQKNRSEFFLAGSFYLAYMDNVEMGFKIFYQHVDFGCWAVSMGVFGPYELTMLGTSFAVIAPKF